MIESRLNIFLDFYNLTQKDLADCTGINRNTVGRYCNNTFEKIDKSHIDLLCSFFMCNFDDLFKVDNTLEVKYPSIMVKNMIESYKVMRKLSDVNINPDTMEIVENTSQDYYYDSNYEDDYIDPVSTMTPDEFADYQNSSREYAIRFDIEIEIDELVSKFINKIIEVFLSSFNELGKPVKQIFKNYEEYNFVTTNLKVNKYYRILHTFLLEYTNDVNFDKLLYSINNIYLNGGLDSLSSDELNKLKNTIENLMNKNIKPKEKG